MNIFIVHSGTDWEMVTRKKEEINEKNKQKDGKLKTKVLLLEYEKKRKRWKPAVKKMIKSAQIVLYVVGKDSHTRKNIDWEICQAKKQNKAIIVWNEQDYPLNETLFEKDPFTGMDVLVGEKIKTIDELVKKIEDYETGEYMHLFNGEEIEPEKLFEQYKMFSDTSESLVSRRQNVNSFYITANTALITIAATAFSLNSNLISQLIITIALSIPGILLNISWLKVLESYSLINSSKMKILGMLEKKLSASLFDAEWEAMSSKYNKKKYVSFSERERQLPIIFNCMFIAVDVICAVILALNFLR